MKTAFIAILTLFVTLSAQAKDTPFSCIVTKVHDTSFLDESLSVEEYPDVFVDKTEAWLGSSYFTEDDGAYILMGRSSDESREAVIVDPSGEVEYLLQVDQRSLVGLLYGQHAGADEANLIAELVCNE